MDQLMCNLRRLQAASIPLAGRAFTPGFGVDVYGGAFEVRAGGSRYEWHGTRRSHDPSHPVVVFQYTLEGWGCYATPTTVYKVTPRMAFTAVIPSEHQYYLPPQSPNWSFCWLIIRHPYVVNRITQCQARVGPFMNLEPESMLIARMVKLLNGIYMGAFHDAFAEEQALFEFMIEYERAAYYLRYPQNERERLLQEVRTLVRRESTQTLEVESIAKDYAMSRSHFSHYFKNTTGISPAFFITQVRLEEAIDLLLHTNRTLAEIALATGFANANHFCKVFRRHYHLSPGAFRSQMRIINESEPGTSTD